MKVKAKDDLLSWVGLRLIPGVGSIRFFRLIDFFGSPKEALNASFSDIKAIKGLNTPIAKAIHQKAWSRDPEEELNQLEKMGAKVITLADKRYPRLLSKIPYPPPMLFVRGDLSALEKGAIAVVGSRKMSPYGRRVANNLGQDLALSGVSLVSGLARGIDTIAHKGSLSQQGHTVGVLGCGLDVSYPRENESLANEMAQKGAVVTEFLLQTPPLAANFPVRNRIISGMSQAVVVVEAGIKSGSLITARHALDQGREVFAVPGPVGSSGASGCHHLINQGARLLQSATDILEPGALPRLLEPISSTPDLKGLPEKAVAIMSLISFDPVHVDVLIRESGLKPEEVKAFLIHLELTGLVERQPGDYYIAQ